MISLTLPKMPKGYYQTSLQELAWGIVVNDENINSIVLEYVFTNAKVFYNKTEEQVKEEVKPIVKKMVLLSKGLDLKEQADFIAFRRRLKRAF